MRMGGGRLAERVAPPIVPSGITNQWVERPRSVNATDVRPMLYSSMKHRTQLYLDEGQYRWLRERAGKSGSIAAAVRELIDAERVRLADPSGDPLLRFLAEEAPGRGRKSTSVSTLDGDLYGS